MLRSIATSILPIVRFVRRKVSGPLRQLHPRTSGIPRCCCACDSGGRCQAPCVATSGPRSKVATTATVSPRDLSRTAPKHETGDGKLASGTLEEVEIPSSERAVKTFSSSASPPHLTATTKKDMAAWKISLLSPPGMRNILPVQCLGWMPGFSHASHAPKRGVSGEDACLLRWLLPHLMMPKTTCVTRHRAGPMEAAHSRRSHVQGASKSASSALVDCANRSPPDGHRQASFPRTKRAVGSRTSLTAVQFCCFREDTVEIMVATQGKAAGTQRLPWFASLGNWFWYLRSLSSFPDSAQSLLATPASGAAVVMSMADSCVAWAARDKASVGRRMGALGRRPSASISDVGSAVLRMEATSTRCSRFSLPSSHLLWRSTARVRNERVPKILVPHPAQIRHHGEISHPWRMRTLVTHSTGANALARLMLVGQLWSSAPASRSSMRAMS